MKTKGLILLCFFVSAFISVNAQKINESKVPQDVFISFKYKYSEAVVSYWEKIGDLYVVKFKLNDQVSKAEYDEKGLWQVTKTEVKEKEMPTPIIDYYKQNYWSKEYVIVVSELHRTAQGESFYFLQLKKEGISQVKPVELHFDLTGKLIYKYDPAEDLIDDKNNGENTDDKPHNQVNVSNYNTGPYSNQGEDTPDDGTKNLIDVSKVPAAAKTHFASKNKKAAGTVWYLIDKKYVVKFNSAGRNGSATYTKEGTWMETRIESSEASLHQLIIKYLKDNYRPYVIKSVENVNKPKDKSVYIRMYDKRDKTVPPLITEIWFTSTGKFINVEKPEIIDPYELERQKRKEEKEKEFLSSVDQKGEKYEDADNYYEKVSIKELPTPIINYVKQNYKEHIIKSAHFYSDDELGNVYLIKVKIEGAKYGIQLFFDISGKLLRKVDETENRVNQDNFKVDNDNQAEEEKPSKYGTPDERVSYGELPSDISKYLKKNYPQHMVYELYFKTDNELGNCYLLILRKTGEKKVIKLYFDMDGNLLRNEMENL